MCFQKATCVEVTAGHIRQCDSESLQQADSLYLEVTQAVVISEAAIQHDRGWRIAGLASVVGAARVAVGIDVVRVGVANVAVGARVRITSALCKDS